MPTRKTTKAKGVASHKLASGVATHQLASGSSSKTKIKKAGAEIADHLMASGLSGGGIFSALAHATGDVLDFFGAGVSGGKTSRKSASKPKPKSSAKKPSAKRSRKVGGASAELFD